MRGDIRANDVVVCVDARPNWQDPRAELLSEGCYYRVGVAGVRADGVFALAFHCLRSHGNKGWAFSATRFRKLEKATPIFAETLRTYLQPEPTEPDLVAELQGRG